MTTHESAFANKLFYMIRERVVAEGLDSNDAFREACGYPVDDIDHEVSGYVSALRDDRPWCVGVSLDVIDQLGWDLDVSLETADASR